MEKMKINESTEYFVDLTVSKHINSQDNTQKIFSNAKMNTSNVIICVN